MRKVLVIGGAGFIGSHLVRGLLKHGYRIAVLVRPGSHNRLFTEANLESRLGDILDKDSLQKALLGMDIVFCAVNVKPSGKSREEYEKELYQVHIEGTKNVIAACRATGTRRLIYFSSVAAMGYAKGMHVYDESFQGKPVDTYGKVKAEAEGILLEASTHAEMDITILRPPGVFGEGGLGALGKIIIFVKKGLVPVIGNGKNKQSIAYVGNIVNQAILSVEKTSSIGKIYIVSDEKAYSVNELIKAVSKALNRNPLVIHTPISLVVFFASFLNFFSNIFLKRAVFNKESIVAIASERIFDGSKIFRELGYREEYGLVSSIGRTIQWYKEQKDG